MVAAFNYLQVVFPTPPFPPANKFMVMHFVILDWEIAINSINYTHRQIPTSTMFDR